MYQNTPRPYYQQIPQTQHNHRSLANNPSPPVQPIQNYNMSDYEFFNSLKHYKPLFYSGEGSPIFMVNSGWYMSLVCIMIMNGLFLLVILLFLQQAGTGIRPMSRQNIHKYTVINIVMMVLVNISYILTQFLNPGIRNLSKISQQEYHEDGSYYCSRCNGDRTDKMQHCPDCEVCIDKLDHHCGFFSKCIGGYQTFAFYAFLTFMFLGFLTLIVTMASNVGL